METFINEVFNIFFLHIESLEPSVFYTYSMAHFGLTTHLKPTKLVAPVLYMRDTLHSLLVHICSIPLIFPLNPASPTQLQLPP